MKTISYIITFLALSLSNKLVVADDLPTVPKELISSVCSCFVGLKKVETTLSFTINEKGTAYGVMLDPPVGKTEDDHSKYLSCVEHKLAQNKFDESLSYTTFYYRLQLIAYNNQPLYENRGKKKGKKR